MSCCIGRPLRHRLALEVSPGSLSIARLLKYRPALKVQRHENRGGAETFFIDVMPVFFLRLLTVPGEPKRNKKQGRGNWQCTGKRNERKGTGNSGTGHSGTGRRRVKKRTRFVTRFERVPGSRLGRVTMCP
eukprot:gene23981-biopygen19379